MLNAMMPKSAKRTGMMPKSRERLCQYDTKNTKTNWDNLNYETNGRQCHGNSLMVASRCTLKSLP